MKNSIRVVGVLITVLATSSLFSCSDAKKEERAQEKDHAEMQRMEAAEKDMEAQRDIFISDARERIEQNKRDIADLKAAAKDKKADAKKQYEESIDKLEAENKRLEETMDNSKKENHEKWENFKREFNHDMDDLGSSIGNLFKDNEKNK